MTGSLMMNFTADWFVAVAQATAGGAILAMLASTMMPEAYENGRRFRNVFNHCRVF